MAPGNGWAQVGDSKRSPDGPMIVVNRLIFTRLHGLRPAQPVGLINWRNTMNADAATEIINFVASQHAIDMIVDLNRSDADKDAMIRDLSAYGPAITERRGN